MLSQAITMETYLRKMLNDYCNGVYLVTIVRMLDTLADGDRNILWGIYYMH